MAFGGEGSVYFIEGDPVHVAKIYHAAPDVALVSKIVAMTAHFETSLESLTAWPSALLSDAIGGTPIGFVMASAVGCKEAHKLYGPRDRKAEFDYADWRFLVRASSNIAKGFATVHGAGCVIGDVNHSSVMVAPDATVRLIDCDSYQLRYGEEFFPCRVGEPLHTAPELYGAHFESVERTANHDAFGLAVLIFELLFMGKHPFAGSFLGSGDPSLEEKIRDSRFAYGRNATTLMVAPPSASLSLGDLPASTAELFERAFAKDRARPSAAQWAVELDSLHDKLETCGVDEAHAYYEGAPACPWCPIEQATGASLFNPGVAFRPNSSIGFDLESAWRAIEAVKAPPAHEGVALPTEPARPGVLAGEAQLKRRLISGGVGLVWFFLMASNLILTPTDAGAWFWLAVVFGVLVYLLVRKLKKDAAEGEFGLMTAEGQLHLAQSRWDSEAGLARFEQLKVDLQSKKRELQTLAHSRALRMSELERTRQPRAWQRHLESWRIAQHSIEGVNLSRCVTLASYGVESAEDITSTSLMAVPGIGDSLRARLLAWRKEVEKKFEFDPSAEVSAADIDELDREIDARQRTLESDLANGAHSLSQCRAEILSARDTLAEPIRAAGLAVNQSKANARALSRW